MLRVLLLQPPAAAASRWPTRWHATLTAEAAVLHGKQQRSEERITQRRKSQRQAEEAGRLYTGFELRIPLKSTRGSTRKQGGEQAGLQGEGIHLLTAVEDQAGQPRKRPQGLLDVGV